MGFAQDDEAAELEFETIESEQMNFWIDLVRSTLALNQCCSEAPSKSLFQQYRPKTNRGDVVPAPRSLAKNVQSDRYGLSQLGVRQ